MTLPLRTRHLNFRTLGLLLLGIVLPLYVVGEIAEDLLEEQRFEFEEPLMLWIHAHASDALTNFSLMMHFIGGYIVMTLVLLALIAILYWRQRREEALLALYGIGGAVLISQVMKFVFNRPRPELWPRLVVENGAAFPSGHSTMAAALATFAVILMWHTRWRWPVLLLALAYALAMAYSRMVLGVHFPTDVLAGLMTGVASVTGVYWLMRRRIKDEEKRAVSAVASAGELVGGEILEKTQLENTQLENTVKKLQQ